MSSWWERYPSVLEREYNAFDDAGIAYLRDDEAWSAGVLQLALTVPSESGAVKLRATYPDLYPYFKPEVFADDLSLPRHQNPVTKNLCIVGRRTSRWYAEDTLARVLCDVLPHFVKLAQTGDVAAIMEVEEPQGEPVTEYYNTDAVPGSAILYDGAWAIDAAQVRGTFTVAVVSRGEFDDVPVFHGCVTQICGTDGTLLASWDGPLPPGHKTKSGRWIRLPQAYLGDLDGLLNSLPPEDLEYLRNERSWPQDRGAVLAAVLFPEEVRQGESADGWAFIEHAISKKKRDRPRRFKKALVRTGRAGPTDLAARMPAVGALANRSAVLIGVGAIGAPIAIELARAGLGRLTIVDADTVEPATIRRWPLGWPAMGSPKVDQLQAHIAEHYPWCEVSPSREKLGDCMRPVDFPRQWGVIEDIVQSADIIVDATAEMGVSHFLSTMARQRQKPYVVATATPGIWGGMVAQFHSQSDQGCWLCLRTALYGDPVRIAPPPADPAGELQPPGCAEPTFTGTAFDVQEVSLEAVRTVVGLLAADYPESPWNVAILTLRAGDGTRVPPSWRGQKIPRIEGCPTCGMP